MTGDPMRCRHPIRLMQARTKEASATTVGVRSARWARLMKSSAGTAAPRRFRPTRSRLQHHSQTPIDRQVNSGPVRGAGDTIIAGDVREL